MPSGSASDWASFLKQHTAEQMKVDNWDAIFSNMLEQQYTAGAEVLEQQAQKDIGSAYGNYLASQIQMRHLDGVTTGYKNTLNKNIDQAYKQSAFATEQTLQQNKNQLLLDVGQQVADYKAQAEKSINDDATRMLKYQQDLLKHAANVEYDGNSLVDEYSELFKFDAKGNVYGWSDIGESFLYERYDPNNPANMRYSDVGKSFMGYLLQDFGDWAQMNYNAKDYGEWLDSGQTLFNNAVFGSDINPYAGDPTVINDFADPVRTAYMKQVSQNNVDVYAGHDIMDNKEVAKIFTMDGLGYGNESDISDRSNVSEYLISKADKSSLESWSEVEGVRYSGKFKDISKERKQLQLMLQQANDLVNTGKLKKGDIFINNGFIAYSKGDGYFKYAIDTPENRKILEKAGIKIGK